MSLRQREDTTMRNGVFSVIRVKILQQDELLENANVGNLGQGEDRHRIHKGL
jgi:hypothetical protein